MKHKTDGHLDIDAVRAGSILVCPVKIPGGGVYLGDMHAMQGDGEIAGHTADVAGTVTLQVEVVKGLGIDGPVLFPLAEDLPFLAKPLTAAERARAVVLAAREGVGAIEESLPISVIGTGPDLNSATDNGLARAAELLGLSRPRGHEPRDDRGRDRDRPRPRRRASDVPRARRRAGIRRPAALRRGAVCLNETATPRERRAGSTSRRLTSTTPSASTASCSAGTPSRRHGRGDRRLHVLPLRRPQGRRRQPADARGPAAAVVDLLRDRRRRRARRARRPSSAATSLFEPMDVMDAGRMGFFAHPAAGAFGAWQAGEHKGAELVNEPVSLAWNTLITPSPEDAAAFFGMVFGLSTETQVFGGDDYVLLTLGETGVAGLMSPPPGMPEGVPAFWGVSFAVEDADATAELAVERGGTLLQEPMDMPGVGRIATVTDPWGASFSVVALSTWIHSPFDRRRTAGVRIPPAGGRAPRAWLRESCVHVTHDATLR